MPVPINATNFKLDSIIGIANAEIGTDAAGDPYTVRRVGGTEESDLGPLLLAWNAVPVASNPRRWFFYQVTDAQRVLSDAAYAALDGVFPLESNLEISGTSVDIESFEVPVPTGGHRANFAGLPGVRDLPSIEADGDAKFSNSRIGTAAEPFDLVSFTLTLGVSLPVVSGVVVNIDRDAPTSGVSRQTPAAARVGLTDAGGVNLQLGTQRSIWAQLVDTSTVPLDAPDGIEAANTTFEETVQYVVREQVPPTSVLIVGEHVFGISAVSPLARGRYWSVTASRRYSGVSL